VETSRCPLTTNGKWRKASPRFDWTHDAHHDIADCDFTARPTSVCPSFLPLHGADPSRWFAHRSGLDSSHVSASRRVVPSLKSSFFGTPLGFWNRINLNLSGRMLTYRVVVIVVGVGRSRSSQLRRLVWTSNLTPSVLDPQV
jgi:hypothetical protein